MFGNSNAPNKTLITAKTKRALLFVEIARHRWRKVLPCCQQYGSPFAGCLLQMSPSAVALLHVAGREIDVLMLTAPLDPICTRKVCSWQGGYANGWPTGGPTSSATRLLLVLLLIRAHLAGFGRPINTGDSVKSENGIDNKRHTNGFQRDPP